tara:strand:- start:106 stop:411 length:306 start_codon:yes stop_codon:yes gene_type:complete
MAKQSAIQKNINRKKLISRLSEKRANLKKLLSNRDLPFEERVKIQMKIESLPRNSSKIRFRNRCFLSGRPRGVYSKFNLSRIAIRDMAGKGQIPGLTKASW